MYQAAMDTKARKEKKARPIREAKAAKIGQKQRFFKVDNNVVMIRSKPRNSRAGNLIGWFVWIKRNQEKQIRYFNAVLTRQEAEDAAFVTWVQSCV